MKNDFVRPERIDHKRVMALHTELREIRAQMNGINKNLSLWKDLRNRYRELMKEIAKNVPKGTRL